MSIIQAISEWLKCDQESGMSLDNGASRGPPYPVDYAPFAPVKTSKPVDTAATEQNEESSTDFYNTKKPTSASSLTLKQTSTPSPSYPSANSWPGFSNRYTGTTTVATTTTVTTATTYGSDDVQTGKRVYVFSSKMANDAALGVRQKKYDSIIAWHEANCRPSTSKCDLTDDCMAAPVTKKKRRSVQDCRVGSPMRSCGTPSICSPSSTMLPTPSQTSGESSGNPPSNPSETPSGELLNPDDHTDIGDNPLRRMERMTQDSLFEPPKLCRASSENNNQPARREQDRNAKLEKMRTLEQQIMYDKAKTEWDRMMHEHEAMKMARGYMPPVMPPCSSQASAPAHYPCTFANQNGMLMQGPCRRPIYPQQMQSTESSTIPMNTSMMVSLPHSSGSNMPMSQPLRPSLNPSSCGMQYSNCGFLCCPYPPNTYPSSQGYPPMNGAVPTVNGTIPSVNNTVPPMNGTVPPANGNIPSMNGNVPSMNGIVASMNNTVPPMNGTASPCFSSNFAPNSGNAHAPPQQPRDYGIYQQGMRAMCPPEKMECELWNRQIPSVPTDFDNNTFPDQKVQYPNGAVVDDKLLDTVANANPMFA